MTIKDLYTSFHEKLRPSSFTFIQNRLHTAPSFGQMRPRQMRITLYFKPAINSSTPRPPSTTQTKLASNRKPAELKHHGKSAGILIAGHTNGSDVTGPKTPYWRPTSSPPTNTQMLRNSANEMAAVAAGGSIHVRPCLTTNRRPAFAAGGRMPSTTNDFITRMPAFSIDSIHGCHPCYGNFGSNNRLHRHLRASHESPTPDRPTGPLE